MDSKIPYLNYGFNSMLLKKCNTDEGVNNEHYTLVAPPLPFALPLSPSSSRASVMCEMCISKFQKYFALTCINCIVHWHLCCVMLLLCLCYEMNYVNHALTSMFYELFIYFITIKCYMLISVNILYFLWIGLNISN